MLAATEIIDVVVAEADETHFRHFQNAVVETKIPVRIQRARCCDQLVTLLTRPDTADCENFKPRLVFLDLSLPDSGSFQFLEMRRNLGELRKIPVIALSDNRDTEWVARIYALGVNSYVPKPSQPEDYRPLIEVLSRYWFGIVKLPGRG